MKTDDQPSTKTPDPVILAPQIERSFQQLPISLAVNVVNGLLLATVLWNAASRIVLLNWLLLLVLVTVARYLTLRGFRKAARRTRLDQSAWARYFVLGAGAAGIVWGAAGVLLFHPTSFPHQVFLIFVLGGMMAGAVPVLSSVRYAYWCFALPVVLPIAIQMLSVRDYVHVVMALMIAVFGVAMLASSTRVYGLFRDSERLRQDLVSAIELSQALEHLARLDSLTEIPNRRLFEEELWREWSRAERNREAIAIIMADIDCFKEYNDRYGHPSGDMCLVNVAQTLQRTLYRPTDVVARIGGEEFAFLLPRTNLQGARAVAEQLYQRILALKLPHDASPVAAQVTLSFGVASSEHPSVRSPAELIRAADAALYEAKRRGRNQIAVSEMENT